MARRAGLQVVNWDITSRCNLHCRHCYAASLYPAVGYPELSTEEAFRLLDDLFTVGVQSLFFYGGEPLLRWDLAELIAQATVGGAKTYIITNGTLLTPGLAESLFTAGLTGLAVSLDAADEAAYFAMRGGDLDRVISRLRQIAALGFGSISLGFVISRNNVGTVVRALELQRELGVSQVVLTPLAYVGRARETWSAKIMLSPEEIIDLAERVAWTVCERNYEAKSIILDFATPPLVNYLNLRFGTDFVFEPQRCEPLRGLFIRADGRAFPCKGAIAQMGLKEPEVYHSQGFDLLKHSLVEVLASDDFGRLFDLANPAQMRLNLPTCQECPYLFTECWPCPISAATPGRSEAEYCHNYPVSVICRLVRQREEGYV